MVGAVAKFEVTRTARDGEFRFDAFLQLRLLFQATARVVIDWLTSASSPLRREDGLTTASTANACKSASDEPGRTIHGDDVRQWPEARADAEVLVDVDRREWRVEAHVHVGQRTIRVQAEADEEASWHERERLVRNAPVTMWLRNGPFDTTQGAPETTRGLRRSLVIRPRLHLHQSEGVMTGPRSHPGAEPWPDRLSGPAWTRERVSSARAGMGGSVPPRANQPSAQASTDHFVVGVVHPHVHRTLWGCLRPVGAERGMTSASNSPDAHRWAITHTPPPHNGHPSFAASGSTGMVRRLIWGGDGFPRSARRVRRREIPPGGSPPPLSLRARHHLMQEETECDGWSLRRIAVQPGVFFLVSHQPRVRGPSARGPCNLIDQREMCRVYLTHN